MNKEEKTKKLVKGKIAPEKELRAGLWLLYLANTHARNLTKNPKTPLEKIEDLMNAISELPNLLMDSDRYDENILVRNLSTYDNKWGKKSDPFTLVDLWKMSKEKYY